VDSNKLEYFISATHSLNFSEVARLHHISQPAISRQIGLLEEELGVKLFMRIGKQLLLTSEGEMFLHEAVMILDAIRNATINVKRLNQGGQGRVTVLVSNTCSAIYRKCLEEFSLCYPNIVIEATVALGYEQQKSINNGDFDFCFCSEYMVKDNDNYEYIITHQDQMFLAMPKSYPPNPDMTDFSGFSDYPFIGISYASSPSLSETIKSICISRGYTPNIIHQYNRIDAAIWSVEAGAGISLIPKSLISLYFTENVNYTPIPGEDCFVNCVAAWQRNIVNSAATMFRDVIIELYSTTDRGE